MKVIARHEEGITINQYEFVLEENGEVKVFNDDDQALAFLNELAEVGQTKDEWAEEGIYILDYKDCFQD